MLCYRNIKENNSTLFPKFSAYLFRRYSYTTFIAFNYGIVKCPNYVRHFSDYRNRFPKFPKHTWQNTKTYIRAEL